MTIFSAHQSLDDDEAETLRVALNYIIPPGNDGSPGVADLGVVDVLDRLATSSNEARAMLLSGLAALDEAAARWRRRTYRELSPAQQLTVLRSFAAEAATAPDEGPTPTGAFFELLRRTAVDTYATHPRIWAELKYPGPSCLQGGYPDYAEPPRS